VFALDRPQRTAETLNEVLDLASTGWHESWIAEFDRVCRPLMDMVTQQTPPATAMESQVEASP
jgi:hypothetical protein